MIIPALSPALFAPQPASAATTWNPSNIGTDIVLSNGNLTASLSTAQGLAVATIGRTTGKYYFEVELSGSATYPEVGIVSGTLNLNTDMGANAKQTNQIAVAIFSANYTNGLFTGNFTGTTGSSAPNIIGVAVDMNGGNVFFAINNTYTTFVSGSNPSTGANPAGTFTPGPTIFPAVGMAFNDNPISGALYGNNTNGLNYTPPSGYSAW